MQIANVGIAGEVRCIVERKDGTVKIDTGYQKNLILNQGLDFFGGNKGSDIGDKCVVGGGNSVPVITQTNLDAAIAIASYESNKDRYQYAYTPGDDFWKQYLERIYVFDKLSNENITEVGLSSSRTDGDRPARLENYWLNTRALIKDALGNPTSISIKYGEVLKVHYRIYKVLPVADKAFVINVLDGDGGAIPYNVTYRLKSVGARRQQIQEPFDASDNLGYTDKELVDITSKISNMKTTAVAYGPKELYKYPYTNGSHVRKLAYSLSTDLANGTIRTIGVTDGYFRLGRVSDDAPLVKTNQHTLFIPFEVSVSRYEGEL
ncbi:hypothetical protein ACTXJH_06550 [Psychrobacter celer]|uniref:hypothetical protein n=1 Tax=Psychrobacter celer TaxID=306572 RepID=UPI003FD26511